METRVSDNQKHFKIVGDDKKKSLIYHWFSAVKYQLLSSSKEWILPFWFGVTVKMDEDTGIVTLEWSCSKLFSSYIHTTTFSFENASTLLQIRLERVKFGNAAGPVSVWKLRVCVLIWTNRNVDVGKQSRWHSWLPADWVSLVIT